MPIDYKKLDNPAWHALTERHAHFSSGTNDFKRYDPTVVLFAGFDTTNSKHFYQVNDVFNINDSFFLFDQFPELPANYSRDAFIECLQMICPHPVIVPATEEIIKLKESNADEMYQLVNTVFPGYYLPYTNRMGDYFGIFKNNELVAMAGERLCMDGLSEVSAVVTHPDYTGRSYARQLMSHIHQKHRSEGIVSFLHTGSANARAIKIYESLGYHKRRLIPVTKIKRMA